MKYVTKYAPSLFTPYSSVFVLYLQTIRGIGIGRAHSLVPVAKLPYMNASAKASYSSGVCAPKSAP
jgi:hypothetical protein